MQKTLLSVALVAMVAGSANAAVVYNRSVPAGPAQRFNPGAWQGDVDAGLPASTQQMIHWDDIGVDPAAMGSNTALQVTKITIGLRRLANAPANTVNIFASQYNAAATNLDDLLGAAATQRVIVVGG
ncbi:MAG TPA: hypothetical protein VK157_09295, partial [Phycisphaerales bacterium]|nr:hypothetical protein [Phycisphaerales bacterium]